MQSVVVVRVVVRAGGWWLVWCGGCACGECGGRICSC